MFRLLSDAPHRSQPDLHTLTVERAESVNVFHAVNRDRDKMDVLELEGSSFARGSYGTLAVACFDAHAPWAWCPAVLVEQRFRWLGLVRRLRGCDHRERIVKDSVMVRRRG